MSTCEIINIGDELLRGEVTNSNAAWLAGRLEEAGLNVSRVVVVGDDFEPLVDELRAAWARGKTILLTGGLGPTDDDRTAAAVAEALGVPLKLDLAALETVRARFAALRVTMSKNNEKQAYFPAGAQILPNARGTAPGFFLEEGSRRFFAMPGVPKEMEGMFEKQVLPHLIAAGEAQPAIIRTLKVFGLGESQIDDKLSDLQERLSNKAVAAQPQAYRLSIHYRTCFPENHVIFVARPLVNNASASAAKELLSPLVKEAHRRLGLTIFGEDQETISSVVVDALVSSRATVAIAESCTGGLVSHLLTNTPGASTVFSLGVVTYGTEAKRQVLEVPGDMLKKEGAVSAECVKAMAENVRQRGEATYGLAISGIAGPDGGSEQRPVGTTHLALATPAGVRHVIRVFPFNRERNKLAAAELALYMLWRELRGDWPAQEDILGGRWASAAAVK